jgi:type II secretory pathway component PulF
MAELSHFAYRAVDAGGRRRQGVLAANSDHEAFERLRGEGLSPLSLKPVKPVVKRPTKSTAPSDRAAADLLSNIADLLRAGADVRTALSILGARSDHPAVKSLCKALIIDIGGGEALDRAFSRNFGRNQALIAALVAAGEASGDLPGCLQRASEMIDARLKLRDQLISVLAYPAFVFASAVAAVFIILLVIVPTIAPLLEDSGREAPPALAIMVGASDFLIGNSAVLGGLLVGLVVVSGVVIRLGLLSGPLSTIFLDGPAKRTVRAVVFGGFAISLGGMLAAGAPMSESLRLAVRSVRSKAARKRLEAVGPRVRQGEPLSSALSAVGSVPNAIVRLASLGEASGSLGQMLVRAGRLEEEGAMKRIHFLGQIAGPALIVFLGALLGLLMAGLLSGISQMGQSTLL